MADMWLRLQLRLMRIKGVAERNEEDAQETFNEAPEILHVISEQLPNIIGMMGGGG